MSNYTEWIGKKVCKKSSKPFKSKLKINTVIGVSINEYTSKVAFTFKEDDSKVNCEMCQLSV